MTTDNSSPFNAAQFTELWKLLLSIVSYTKSQLRMVGAMHCDDMYVTQNLVGGTVVRFLRSFYAQM